MEKKPNSAWEKFKRPSTLICILTFLVFVASLAGAITVLVLGIDNALSYVVYALSALSLAYTVYIIVIYSRGAKNKIIEILRSNSLTSKILDEFDFRTLVFGVCKVIVNVLHVAVTILIAILSHSAFYGAISVFYVCLIALRMLVSLLYRKRNDIAIEEKSLKKYHLCGVMLIILSLAHYPVLFWLLMFDITLAYGDIFIFAVAAYAFYKITLAILNIVKSRKSESLITKSLTAINMADALITIFMLQIALINTFSTGTENIQLMNYLSGGAVCLITIALGVLVLIKTKKIKEKRKNGQ